MEPGGNQLLEGVEFEVLLTPRHQLNRAQKLVKVGQQGDHLLKSEMDLFYNVCLFIPGPPEDRSLGGQTDS